MASNGHIDDTTVALRALASRSYTRRVVRDLLWVATSPHLIAAELFPVLPVAFGLGGDSDGAVSQLRAWLAQLEVDPAHLIAFLQGCVTSARASDKPKPRAKALALGVYFASLLEYWIQFCPLLCVARFERGKQIVSATNQTLGQLKFLFRVLRGEQDDSDAFDDFHVECSVKFFLLHPLNEQFQSRSERVEPSGVGYPLEQFVGPHLGENLAWRVQEVARKLDMCRGGSVQTWLRDHYSDRVASRIVLKGYLFYPLHHFTSTSEVSCGHDWCFHLNPTSSQGSSVRHNPKIGEGHLRGWWASDLEQEFVSRVRANDTARLGESRFVVLPKLYWLTPLIAEEDEATGRVVVEGEPELHIENVDSMSLDELVAFARSHFATLAEAPPSGGVVMPLLVAEIVRCRVEDVEYDPQVCRWKELSRGFLLDPRSWDPLPLCHDAVRYKRTNDDDGVSGEREYEGRREWVNDGVIKPTNQEAELARKQKLHSFADVDAVTPESMCQELLAILARDQKTFTHANLKQSVQSVLSRQSIAALLNGQSLFLLECLKCLVLGQRDGGSGYLEDSNGSKVVQRTAHLLLDAFEARAGHSAELSTVLKFVELFDNISRDETQWDCINLTLRAIDVHIRACSMIDAFDVRGVFPPALDCLLQKKTPRWNAVAVEVVRVIYADATTDAASSLRRAMLSTLVDQNDWKHAEQLVTICCHTDVELLFTLYQRLSELNMTKPMKRLRKALGRVHEVTASERLGEGGQRNLVRPHAIGLQHALGPPLDADANLTCIVGQIPPLELTLADTLSHIEDIISKLQHLMETRQHQPTLIGLDCEWRPQFLVKENALADITETESGTDELPVGEHEGVSVYQIAIDDHVYVVDVQVLGAVAEAPLAFIWNAPRGAFILVGFCVSGDLRRLNHSFPALLPRATNKLLVELKQLALYRQLPASTWGLSQLYEACFREQIDKEEQCSDWGLRPLSESQLVYAARDAYAVRNVALHLLADVASVEEDITKYVERFAVVTNLHESGNIRDAEAALGHWLTPLTPLNESHVRAALTALGLSSIAASLFVVDKALWRDQARLPQGLVVKTIAVVLRRGGRAPHGDVVHYAAVVLNVDLSIRMAALAAHLQVHVDDLQLADRETLLRVFGYPRGSIGPIGLREQHAVHVVLDAALLSETALLPGAGREDLTYAVAPHVVVETIGASIAPLASEL